MNKRFSVLLVLGLLLAGACGLCLAAGALNSDRAGGTALVNDVRHVQAPMPEYQKWIDDGGLWKESGKAKNSARAYLKVFS